MSDIWFVRAGQDGIYAEDFIQRGVVAIGAPEAGEVTEKTTKAELLEAYQAGYPNHTAGKKKSSVSQLLRFVQEIQVGQPIMTYDRDQQVYYLGKVESKCEWKPDIIPDFPRVRQVSWEQAVPRSALSAETRNTLGAIQTLFLVRGKPAQEIREKAKPVSELELAPPVTESPSITQDEEREVQAELVDKVEQAIEDRIRQLDWEQTQELVAGILRAMGYRTTVSPRGSDRGVDVFASPDGIGLEEPRIFVEVKHRPTTKISAQDIRSFLGGRKSGDKCLYVSTGGFTQEGRYEADRANVPITLLSLVDLRKLLLDYYEKMDAEARSIIPLKRVYVLVD